MGEKMQALVFHGPGNLKLDDVEKPKAKAGEIIIEVKAAGVCASDLRVFKGERSAKEGIILGHEVVGTIAEVGLGADGFHDGERVTLYPVVSCGLCFFCREGYPSICPDKRLFGFEYDGAFADYMRIPREVVGRGNVLKVPETISNEEAALTEPLACSINGIETLRLQVGETLLIVGAGPMGLLAMKVAKASGAGRIIVSELRKDRLEAARAMGADAVVNPKDEDLASRVKGETDGLGADAALVSIGSPAAALDALRAVRKGGRINFFAGFPPATVIALDPNLIHYGLVTITASQNSTLTQFKRALTIMETHRVELKDIVTHRYLLKDALKAFEGRLSLEGLKYELFPRF
ncbi:MAG: alcohol dehydrogenase catalytic domain-containing protein [Candidatus Bathyarchaeia archaeon]